MTDQKTEQKPADHKAIREALEADPYLTANVAKDDLRALLAGMDEARAALSAAKAGGWQDISTAPKDVVFLAVLDCGGEQTICTMRHAVAASKNSRPDGDFIRERVTHWQPLPAPPAQKENT